MDSKMRFRDQRPAVVKQCEPKGVAQLFPVTPQRLSIWADAPGGTVKNEFKDLKQYVFGPTQNRAYRRSMRKPLRPLNLRRRAARMRLFDA